MCFDFLYNVSAKTFYFWEEFCNVLSQMYIGIHTNYPLFLSDSNVTSNFLDRCSKNTKISDLMKICPLVAELFHEDVQTDMRKLTVAFRNFTNAPKNGYSVWNVLDWQQQQRTRKRNTSGSINTLNCSCSHAKNFHSLHSIWNILMSLFYNSVLTRSFHRLFEVHKGYFNH